MFSAMDALMRDAVSSGSCNGAPLDSVLTIAVLFCIGWYPFVGEIRIALYNCVYITLLTRVGYEFFSNFCIFFISVLYSSNQFWVAPPRSGTHSEITKRKDIIETEEATKNAFVMPFINLLGYN